MQARTLLKLGSKVQIRSYKKINVAINAEPGQNGGVAIIIPAVECGLTIEEIATKDVPVGKPYKIVDVADIPTDRTFRNAWEYA